MTITLYIAIATLICFLMYGIFFRRRSSPVQTIPLEDVNVSALSNLMDPAEQDYLNRELSGREYRSLHRRRMRIALAYLRELGDALPLAPDATSHAALNRARLLIFELKCRAAFSYLVPGFRLRAPELRTPELTRLVAQLVTVER